MIFNLLWFPRLSRQMGFFLGKLAQWVRAAHSAGDWGKKGLGEFAGAIASWSIVNTMELLMVSAARSH